MAHPSRYKFDPRIMAHAVKENRAWAELSKFLSEMEEAIGNGATVGVRLDQKDGLTFGLTFLIEWTNPKLSLIRSLTNLTLVNPKPKDAAKDVIISLAKEFYNGKTRLCKDCGQESAIQRVPGCLRHPVL